MSEAEILAFCRARLDDTEALVTALLLPATTASAGPVDPATGAPQWSKVLEHDPGRWTAVPEGGVVAAKRTALVLTNAPAAKVYVQSWDDEVSALAMAQHIAKNCPSRALASVNADRAMLAEVESWTHPEPCAFALSRDFRDTGGSGDLEPCDCLLTERRMAILEPMAARDSGHPDYRLEWAL